MKKTILWLAITALLVMLPILALAQEAGYLPQEQLMDGEAISYNSPAVKTAITNAVADRGDANSPADVKKYAEYIGINAMEDDYFSWLRDSKINDLLSTMYDCMDDAPVPGVTDLSCLQFCQNAKVIYINCEEVTGLEALTTLPKLTTLYIRVQKPIDLSALGGIKKLSSVGFSQCEELDYAPLSKIKSIQELLFYKCDMVDMLFTLGLSKLNTVTIVDTPTKNIALLAGAKKLDAAVLENVNITGEELGAIVSNTSIGFLDVNGLDASGCDALFDSKTLYGLFLTDCTNLPQDPEAWAKLKKLWQVGIDGCDYFSIDCFENMKSLESIFISNMDIMGEAGTKADGTNVNADPERWAKLKKLRDISIDNCNLTNCDFVAECTKLIAFSATNNQITDISPLAGLKNLTTLYLGNNDIADISAIADMKKLMDLFIGSNNVTDISILADMNKLLYLDIGGNPITDYSVLDGMEQLEYLER